MKRVPALLLIGLAACGGPNAVARGTPDGSPLEEEDAEAGTTLVDVSPEAPRGVPSPERVVDTPPPPPGPFPGDAGTPVPWVNPSRCATPCADTPTDLVRVDHQGRTSPSGAFRVRAEAVPHLRLLLEDATRAGHNLSINSAYRSYAEQDAVFTRYSSSPGRAAQPGHSEHNLGLAVDINLPTYAGLVWLARSIAPYGFVLSYPAGKQRVTGYQYEPWHIRFVGLELAQRLSDWDVTLEEYLQANPQQGVSGDCSDCPTASALAPCGTTTEAGVCSSQVLSWCFDGMLAHLDCRSAQLTCKLDVDLAQVDCLP